MAEHMPAELLSHIFQFMCHADRQEVSVVCKHWYYASLDPALHQNTVITLRASASTGKHLQDLGLRKSPNLVITYVEGSNADFLLREVGRHLGPHLRSLCLKGCDITGKMFMGIISHCENLSSLDLSCCNNMFMSGTLLQKEEDQRIGCLAFKKLKNLHLGSIRFLSDALFNQFVATTPNLEHVSLAGCNIAFETDPYRNREIENDSVTMLTFSNLLAFVKKNVATLKSLDFSLTSITSTALTSLANVPNLKLERISLVRCSNLTDEGVKNLSALQTDLKEVIIVSCPSVGNPAINAITKNLVNMERLYLNKLKSIPQDTFEQITTSLGRLTHLSLASNLNLKGTQMLKGLKGASFAQLRYLNLQGCPQVDDEVIFCICDAAPGLEDLNLNSSLAMTDLGLHRISSHLHKLRRLNLSWCQRITDFGLLGMDKDCPLLAPPDESSKHSSDRYTRNHSNIGFFRPLKFEEVISTVSEEEMQEYLNSTTRVGINAIATMEYLNLANCHHLTDRCIQESISFPRLRSLDLRMCRNITDKSLQAIAENNPHLQDLTISECRQITDVGVTAIASRATRLSTLIMPRCLITETCLEALALYCRHLKVLDVSQCNVPVTAVDKLRTRLPSLQTVITSYLDGDISTTYQPEFF